MADGEQDHLLVELSHPLDPFTTPLLDLVDHLLQRFLQARDRRFDARLVLLRQLGVLLRAHYLIAFGRCEGESVRRAQ